MNPSYVLIELQDEQDLPRFCHFLDKIIPHDYSFDEKNGNAFLFSFTSGNKSLSIFQASFLALSHDLFLGIKALIVPSNNPIFDTFLSLVNPGECRYLFELGIRSPKIFEECQGLLEGIDNETLYTIMVYIETERSPSLSALRLYVHRNTVAYRLSRFVSVTGITLDSFGNEMFVYSLLNGRKDEFSNLYSLAQ